jgi:hypothetical protein
MNNYQWTPEDEAAYFEERKSKCDHCHPVHEDTIKWLESVANQDLIYSVYSQYGINPDTIYKEFEAEITVREKERIIPELIEHVA